VCDVCGHRVGDHTMDGQCGVCPCNGDEIEPPLDSAALIELVDADHRDHGIPDRSVPHDCADFHYPCPAIEPPSIRVEVRCPRCGEPTFGYPDPEAPEYADDVCLSCDRYQANDPTMGLGNG